MVGSGNGLNFIKDAYPKITFTENRTGDVHRNIVLRCNTLRSWNKMVRNQLKNQPWW